ncbi:flagellin N-terminal helical domain-containing protein [Chromobacterium haemolyticum]|uniref:flagellin N-terminal helical domain-containing protein n=1 Tax=Chromobacterium haemolyticum TaxID=394935 RepID=UPI0009DA59AB|nr:flagellin [Chromobacterium haemolyticum]OQS33855.1 hypothetical protein B0T39_20245 [Chromobacterium haemolyticum]
MGMSINNNLAAQQIQLILKKNQSSLTSAQTNLGTGKRINSSADDAAGLQIAQRLQMQISGLTAANKNISRSNDMMRAADKSFEELGGLLDKMKGLATQAADSSLSQKDRAAMDAEYVELKKQAEQILGQTTYGDEKLLVGGKLEEALNFQIGAGADEKLAFDKSVLLKAIHEAVGGLVKETDEKVWEKDAAKAATLADATVALGKKLVSGVNFDEKVIGKDGTEVDLFVKDKSGKFVFDDKGDADAYKLNPELVKLGIEVDDSDPAKFEYVGYKDSGKTEAVTKGISDAGEAQKMIGALSLIADQAGEFRSAIGAAINRLDSSKRSNDNMTEAMRSSKDGIESTDMAEESTVQSSFNVKTQAAVQMLKQSTMADQNVLALLS